MIGLEVLVGLRALAECAHSCIFHKLHTVTYSKDRELIIRIRNANALGFSSHYFLGKSHLQNRHWHVRNMCMKLASVRQSFDQRRPPIAQKAFHFSGCSAYLSTFKRSVARGNRYDLRPRCILFLPLRIAVPQTIPPNEGGIVLEGQFWTLGLS